MFEETRTAPAVNVSARQAYSKQDCAKTILDQWNTAEPGKFRESLDAYLGEAKVTGRYKAVEG